MIDEREPLQVDEYHLEFLRSIRDAAQQAINDHIEAARYKREADYYRKEYAKLINQSIREGEQLMGNMLKLVLECDIRPRAAVKEGE